MWNYEIELKTLGSTHMKKEVPSTSFSYLSGGQHRVPKEGEHDKYLVDIDQFKLTQLIF